MNPRLGFILMFEGDARVVRAAIKNVTTFTAVSAVLKNGDVDVTSLYIDTLPTFSGNILISDKIGGKAAIAPGDYRYFITATHGGKARTWFWDILVLPKNTLLLDGMDLTVEDYDPLIEEVTVYEGDNLSKQILVPDVEFSAASGAFHQFADNVTATFCAGSASASGNTLTTHNIGGLATIPAGEYGYFLTGTYNSGDCVSTWYYKIRVLAKQGAL